MPIFWLAFVAVFLAATVTAASLIPWLSSAPVVPLLLVDVILLTVLAWLASRWISRPLTELRSMVDALTRGEQGRRTRILPTGELGDLAVGLNRLAEYVDDEMAPLRTEQAQTAEILGAMSDGVLLLDAGGRVLRTNPAASQMLDVPVDKLGGQSIVHAARTFPAVSLAEQALRARNPVETHVEMPGGRRLQVQSIPLKAGSQSAERGGLGDDSVLMIIRDETERVRVERMRRDFAANASHELKTPLTGIALLATTLEYAVDDDPQEARRFIRRLSAEVAGMNNLMTDLLTLSRLEEAPPPEIGQTEAVDLSEVARTAALRVEDRAHSGEVSLEVNGPTGVLVSGNRVDLETMARNLVENAVRFTDPGGHVWVTVGNTATEALLRVRDDGIGIPRDDQARIFERFYRVDKARSRETGGTGLGLSIVRHVAEGHDGHVELESLVGVGSTFTVHLPLAGVDGASYDGSAAGEATRSEASGDEAPPVHTPSAKNA